MPPNESPPIFFDRSQPSLDATRRFTSIHQPGRTDEPSAPPHDSAFQHHWLRTLAHVLVEEIHELYQIEKILGDNLTQVALAAAEPMLRFLTQIHVKQTSEQLQRLDQVHQMLGQTPDGRACLELDTLLTGLREIILENHPGRARDAALLAVTRKIMQREITSYCNARDYAQLLGLEPVTALLQKNLTEEAALQQRLTNLSLLLAPKANGRTIL